MIRAITESSEAEADSFDWFKSYTDIADLIREIIPEKSSRILMLGCGNSKLSEDVRRSSSSHIRLVLI